MCRISRFVTPSTPLETAMSHIISERLKTALCAIILLLLSYSPGTTTAFAQWPVTISDSRGQSVTVEGRPTRIVSLIPSNTEILFSLGLDERIVGVTEYCDFPERAKAKPKIGDLLTFSVERILGTRPDLVLATTDNPGEVIKGLEQLGVTVFVLNPQTVQQVAEAMVTVGRLTGTQSRADSLVNDMRNRMNLVATRLRGIAATERVTVFLGNPKYPSQWTPGPGTFTSHIIELSGGTNVVHDIGEGTWGVYSLENLVAKDPDVLLVTTDGNEPRDVTVDAISDVASSLPGWRELSAVRNKRIHAITGNWISRPGPRVILSVEEIARLLYPSLFPSE